MYKVLISFCGVQLLQSHIYKTVLTKIPWDPTNKLSRSLDGH